MDRARWRRLGTLALWIVLGGMIIAAFYVATFFSDYSPFAIEDEGAVILFVPLLTGFLLGVLLTDEEIVVATGAGLLTAVVAVTFVGLFLTAPVLAGVAKAMQPFVAFSLTNIAFASIMLFPLTIVGAVIGRGVGDMFFPSTRLREQLEKLREETRQWHAALERMEHRSEEGKSVEPPKEEKG